MDKFISLHNQTHFSILDALPTPQELLLKAKELNQSAIAITDHSTLAGVWEAYKAYKDTGVKLIVGSEFNFVPSISLLNDNIKLRSIVLIAKNLKGYQNLLLLTKQSFDYAIKLTKKIIPVIDWEFLEKYSEGLICLTGCGLGIIGQNINLKNFDQAEQDLVRLKSIFGDNLGAEVQPNALNRNATYYYTQVNQIFTNYHTIRLAKKINIKVVPTCNAHYLEKNDAEVHDIFLAIGSMQPYYSNARLRYNVPDFYLKSYEEVKTFFARNYGEDFAEEICKNSVDFANMCENPDWVDPKFTNPSGKELPIFPIKDEKKYPEYLEWKKNQDDKIQKLPEDQSYLRFLCLQELVNKIPKDKHKKYLERLDEEFDVLEYHDFSSYMLMVSDYVNWAKDNGVLVGPGRGCLTGDTQVLTSCGYKNLSEIEVGDSVYTHTGKLKKVLNTFKFDVSNEELLEFKISNSLGTLKMTSDHKVFACKQTKDYYYKNYHYGNKTKKVKLSKIVYSEPSWIRAKDLSKGDFIYHTFPNYCKKDYQKIFDLSKFTKINEVKSNTIVINTSKNKQVSFREISNNTQLSFEVVRKVYHNKLSSKTEQYKKINSYLSTKNISITKWRKQPKYSNYEINRFIKLNDDFLYLLGRWVGDGSYQSGNNGINIAFHKEDLDGINKIKKYLMSLGFNPRIRTDKYNCTSITVSGSIISNLFRKIFNDYQRSSQTKHLPNFFRKLSKNQLMILLQGLIDSDGYAFDDNVVIKTTSQRLSLEIKEALTLLNIKATVYVEKEPKRNGKITSPAYTIKFINFNTVKLAHRQFNNGYYCVVNDIKSCKDQFVYDITVDKDHSYLTINGVVHNSVGGSLVAYLLGIHKADPIIYNLIFARFHNKEKTSFPDIDLDFDPVGRDKVQNYIRNKYGEECVAHVSNINTITPKVYARDVSRACELGGSRQDAVKLGNDIADSIPKEMKEDDISSLLEKAPLFAEYAKRYPQIKRFSKINGKYRAWATHAAGLIVSKRPLHEIVPIRKDKDGSVAIQFDKIDAEENGLVKIDTLGLETLNIINTTYDLIKKYKNETPPLDPPLDDKATYDLISRGETLCVFQLGTSAGTMDLCKKVKPKSIDDISHINSLARPAAKNIRQSFIETKEGKKPVELLHPSLKRAFGFTYGFGLYEESLMFLAQDVAGWNLHSADRLRKLTKEKGKNPKKVLQWRDEFIEDAVKNNIPKNIAIKIWDDVIAGFSGYGFNLSHSVLYSMISYHTAYLKAHYPIEFLLANLMSEVKSVNKKVAAKNIDAIKNELRKYKVKILPPDINKSDMVYTLVDNNTLLTGLDSLKFVGDDAVKELVEKRPFKNFFDFMYRIDSSKIRSNAIQALAASGCLDDFGLSRKAIYLYCSDYRKKMQNWLKSHNPDTEEFKYPWPNDVNEWTPSEIFALEKNYLGESFSYTKTDAFGSFYKTGKYLNLSFINKAPNKTQIPSIKAEVKDIFEFKVKKQGSKFFGEPMLKVLIEDEKNNVATLTIFPDKLKEVKNRIRDLYKNKYTFSEGISIHFSATVNIYEEETGLILDTLYDISPKPSLPKDLKSKQVEMKISKIKKDDASLDNLIENLEDELFDIGLIDLDNENNDI